MLIMLLYLTVNLQWLRYKTTCGCSDWQPSRFINTVGKDGVCRVSVRDTETGDPARLPAQVPGQ